VKDTFTNRGECKRWNPMTPKCTPIVEITLVWESQMFRAWVEKTNKHQIRPARYHGKGLEIYILKVISHYSFRFKMHKL
jgi:hypothetical protein